VTERVAFIGSRNFGDGALVRERVRSLHPGDVVVSGGARGVDTIAETEARRIGLEVSVHRVTSEAWATSKLAGKERNWTLIAESNRVEAFWDGASNGTAHAISVACRLRRPVRVWMEGDS
jgi:hypothetical protein